MDVEETRIVRDARLLKGLGPHLVEWTQSRRRTKGQVNYVDSNGLHALRGDLKNEGIKTTSDRCRSRRMLMSRVATY